ncbi:unnamed protein product [Schistosoma turkestanicum]|nr:unnamed protein product [Schistosoma turkestanicum]
MAKCCISGEKFVNFVFSPCIGLLVSPDVNELCLRDNLTFEELLRPFSQLSRDVTLRDNNNVVHSVKNLQLKFFDISSSPVPKHVKQSWLRYFVNVCSTDNTVRSQKFCDGSRSVVVPVSLPWFEAWRYLFITNLQPFEHEFINHHLACIFVLTTAHPDPIRGFTDLTQSQSNQQHHQPGSYPLWFTENVLRFYVLLHDGSSKTITQNCVDEIFNQVKTTFGAANCHLLTIFTASTSTSSSSSLTPSSPSGSELFISNNGCASILFSNHHYQVNGIINQSNISSPTMEQKEPQSDPWLHHLLPHGYKPQLDQKLFPPREDDDHDDNISPRVECVVNPMKNCNIDPLKVGDSKEGVCSQIFDPSKTSLHDTSCLPATSVHHSQSPMYPFLPYRYSQPHGQHLTQADRDRIHMFVYDFSVRALLPWVEKTMRSLNDQIAHRMRLSRSFFSATKKFFTQAVGGGGGGGGGAGAVGTGGINTTTTISTVSSNNTTTNNLTTSKIYPNQSLSSLPPNEISTNSTISNACDPVNPTNVIVNHSKDELSSPPPNSSSISSSILTPHQNNTATINHHQHHHSTIVYSYDSPESQMRRLADLAFLFQQYEVAYQTYNVLKRDFQNDSSWLHYAGAQEMSALSVYLQGGTSQRQYPYHFMDSAVTTYLQSHLSLELALRSTLLNFEALCSRGLYNEAAMALIRLTSDEDDLISGLLIEQIAYCVLSLKRPMLRKFAFRMALAAHRYSRAKQPYLAIRSYKLAMPIVMGHGWSLLEDHINFSVGKQAYLIGDLTASSKTLAETLNSSSRQSAERQLLFVKEYLSVLTNLLLLSSSSSNKCDTVSLKQQSLPEFPLPIIDLRHFKIMIGKPSQQEADLFIEARGVQFSDTEDDDEDIDDQSQGTTTTTDRDTATDHLFDNVEFQQYTKQYQNWIEATDISSSDSDISNDEQEEEDNNNNDNHRIDTRRSHENCHTSQLLQNVNWKKITSPHSMVYQRLEYILMQTTPLPMHSSCDLFKREKIIYTSRTKCKQMLPTFPLGEYLTLQITLINPMRIPLVFTNVHLLWLFQLLANTDPHHHHHHQSSTTGCCCCCITNEMPIHAIHSHQYEQQQKLNNEYISSQIISELIMLPGERKILQLSLIAKQLGEITITGLGFEWNYLPTHQNHAETHPHHYPVVNASSFIIDPTMPNNMYMNSSRDDIDDGKHLPTMDTSLSSPPPLSATSTMTTTATTATTTAAARTTTMMMNDSYVVNAIGERRHSVKGKILFQTKQSSISNKIIDHSTPRLPLQWSVTQPAPSLRVFFSSFPSQLYKGQLCCIQISLTNNGLIPLTNLRIASNWPGLFAFGSIPCDHLSSQQQPIQQLSIQPLKLWIDVPCNQPSLNNNHDHTAKQSNILMPGTTITQKLWLRGPYLTTYSSHYRKRHPNRYAQLNSTTTSSSLHQNFDGGGGGYSSSSSTSLSSFSSIINPTLPVVIPIINNSNTEVLSSHLQQKTVHIVFQYESVNNNNTKVPIEPQPQQQKPTFSGCRYVRHRSELELKPSLNFEAVANCLNMTGINDVLISVQIKNVVNANIPLMFQILQIACISQHWCIKPIESVHNNNIDIVPSIHVGEMITIYLKANLIKTNLNTAETDHSHVEQQQQLNEDKTSTAAVQNKFLSVIHFNYQSMKNADSSQSAAANNNNTSDTDDKMMMRMISSSQLEFFYRSGIHWYHSNNNNSSKSFNEALPLDINLIITWKALTETTPTTTNLQQPIWGQSHLRINQLNYPIQMPYTFDRNYNILDKLTSSSSSSSSLSCKRTLKKSKHKINFLSNKNTNSIIIINETIDLSNLIRFRLNYPKHVNYLKNYKIINNNHDMLLKDIGSLNRSHDDAESLFNLIDHTRQLSCETLKKRLIPITVQAEFYNSSKWSLLVQLECLNQKCRKITNTDYEHKSISDPMSTSSTSPTSHPQQQINPFRVYNFSSSSSQMESISHDTTTTLHIPSLIWIGLTKQTFHLSPYQMKYVTLKALVPQPGIYNLCNAWNIKATPLPSSSCHSHSQVTTINATTTTTSYLVENQNRSSLIIVE